MKCDREYCTSHFLSFIQLIHISFTNCTKCFKRFTSTPLPLPSKLVFHVKCPFFPFIFQSFPDPSSIFSSIVCFFRSPHISTLPPIFSSSPAFHSCPLPHLPFLFPPFHPSMYSSAPDTLIGYNFLLIKPLLLTSECPSLRKGDSKVDQKCFKICSFQLC